MMKIVEDCIKQTFFPVSHLVSMNWVYKLSACKICYRIVFVSCNNAMLGMGIWRIFVLVNNFTFMFFKTFSDWVTQYSICSGDAYNVNVFVIRMLNIFADFVVDILKVKIRTVSIHTKLYVRTTSQHRCDFSIPTSNFTGYTHYIIHNTFLVTAFSLILSLQCVLVHLVYTYTMYIHTYILISCILVIVMMYSDRLKLSNTLTFSQSHNNQL